MEEAISEHNPKALWVTLMEVTYDLHEYARIKSTHFIA
jgi:hypothetical protein